MNRYSISQIVLFTGINSHSLRIWERRYGFLKPKRTKTNIRFYSDQELRMLLNIKVLLAHGYKISKMDLYTNEEIQDLALEVTKGVIKDVSDVINRLILSMLDLDEDAFNRIYLSQSAERGMLPFILDVIYPFLERVGILWSTNKASVAEEHFISNLIRQKIIYEINILPAPAPDVKKVALFLLNNEDHEIGLLLASYIIKKFGYRCYYLGQKVPINTIQDVLRKINPDLIVTMYIISKPAMIISNLAEQKEFSDCKIAIAGNENLFKSIDLPEDVISLNHPKDLIDLLSEI